MKSVHVGLENKTFLEEKPEGVVEVEVCKKSGFLATSSCKHSGTAYKEYFVEGTEPIGTCPYHSGTKICIESGKLAKSSCTKTKTVWSTGELIDNHGLWQSNYSNTKISLERCDIH